jgi:hypothetical protein
MPCGFPDRADPPGRPGLPRPTDTDAQTVAESERIAAGETSLDEALTRLRERIAAGDFKTG